MVLFAKSALTKAYLMSSRAFSTTPSNSFAYMIKSLSKPSPKVPHPTHVKSVNMWRNLFFLAALPAIALVNINVEFFEEHHPKRADFKPFEYMRKRQKKFPWGDGNHSLFHNEYYNALPEGYETEDDWLEKHVAHGKH